MCFFGTKKKGISIFIGKPQKKTNALSEKAAIAMGFRKQAFVLRGEIVRHIWKLLVLQNAITDLRRRHENEVQSSDERMMLQNRGAKGAPRTRVVTYHDWKVANTKRLEVAEEGALHLGKGNSSGYEKILTWLID